MHLFQGSSTWWPLRQVTRKDHVGPPGACSENNISMINVFTLTNINTEVSEGKLHKNFISEVCMKLVALCIDRYQGCI